MRGLFSRIYRYGLQRGRDVPLTIHERRGCFVDGPVVNSNQPQYCRSDEYRPFIAVPQQFVIFLLLLNFDVKFMFFLFLIISINFLIFFHRRRGAVCEAHGCRFHPSNRPVDRIHVPNVLPVPRPRPCPGERRHVVDK